VREATTLVRQANNVGPCAETGGERPGLADAPLPVLTSDADGAAIANPPCTNAAARQLRRGAIMSVQPEPTVLHPVAERVDAVAADLRRLTASDGEPSAR
jgi:hypothetical protein